MVDKKSSKINSSQGYYSTNASSNKFEKSLGESVNTIKKIKKATDYKDKKLVVPFDQARKPMPVHTINSESFISVNQELHIDFDEIGNPYFRD